MSGVVHTFKNWTEDIAGWFGLKHAYDRLGHKTMGSVFNDGSPTPPPPPNAPTLDSASNAANQQADAQRRRRAVLANIYAGSDAAAPTVSSKQLLGQ